MNNENWQPMETISLVKKRKREIKKLFNMIKDAKISCYDNLEVYYGLDYMTYIPEENFLEFMEIWKELYESCCLCGEETCNCLEERRSSND